MLNCPEEPIAPIATKQSEVAYYLADLRNWGACANDKLKQVAALNH